MSITEDIATVDPLIAQWADNHAQLETVSERKRALKSELEPILGKYSYEELTAEDVKRQINKSILVGLNKWDELQTMTKIRDSFNRKTKTNAYRANEQKFNTLNTMLRRFFQSLLADMGKTPAIPPAAQPPAATAASSSNQPPAAAAASSSNQPPAAAAASSSNQPPAAAASSSNQPPAAAASNQPSAAAASNQPSAAAAASNAASVSATVSSGSSIAVDKAYTALQHVDFETIAAAYKQRLKERQPDEYADTDEDEPASKKAKTDQPAAPAVQRTPRRAAATDKFVTAIDCEEFTVFAHHSKSKRAIAKVDKSIAEAIDVFDLTGEAEEDVEWCHSIRHKDKNYVVMFMLLDNVENFPPELKARFTPKRPTASGSSSSSNVRDAVEAELSDDLLVNSSDNDSDEEEE